MCFYWLIEHPCGHTTENIQKTVLSHCSLVDTCLRNWHQQRQYCTLEVDNPGITLPQPKTCPRVWTIDQYNGVEDEEFRTAREDGTKRVMGSFIKKQEDLLALDREARQIRDRAKREFRSQQDTIEDETEAERLEHQQQALLEDLRRVSGEEHDDDGEKNALIQIVKALPLGGQLNLEYPDIYRLQFDLLDAYQRRQHPSVNVITQKSKIGCGLQSTPECMAGHAEDGMLMCPWLMAQRLREAGKDRKELRVLADDTRRGGATMGLENPLLTQVIRCAVRVTDGSIGIADGLFEDSVSTHSGDDRVLLPSDSAAVEHDMTLSGTVEGSNVGGVSKEVSPTLRVATEEATGDATLHNQKTSGPESSQPELTDPTKSARTRADVDTETQDVKELSHPIKPVENKVQLSEDLQAEQPGTNDEVEALESEPSPQDQTEPSYEAAEDVFRICYHPSDQVPRETLSATQEPTQTVGHVVTGAIPDHVYEGLLQIFPPGPFFSDGTNVADWEVQNRQSLVTKKGQGNPFKPTGIVQVSPEDPFQITTITSYRPAWYKPPREGFFGTGEPGNPSFFDQDFGSPSAGTTPSKVSFAPQAAASTWGRPKPMNASGYGMRPSSTGQNTFRPAYNLHGQPFSYFHPGLQHHNIDPYAPNTSMSNDHRNSAALQHHTQSAQTAPIYEEVETKPLSPHYHPEHYTRTFNPTAPAFYPSSQSNFYGMNIPYTPPNYNYYDPGFGAVEQPIPQWSARSTIAQAPNGPMSWPNTRLMANAQAYDPRLASWMYQPGAAYTPFGATGAGVQVTAWAGHEANIDAQAATYSFSRGFRRGRRGGYGHRGGFGACGFGRGRGGQHVSPIHENEDEVKLTEEEVVAASAKTMAEPRQATEGWVWTGV